MDRKNESDWVKYYKELADAQSTEEKIINPVDLIEKDLFVLDKIALNKENKRFLKKRIRDYKSPRSRAPEASGASRGMD